MSKAIEAAQEQSDSRQDLYAQRDMSKWAFWLLILTAATVGITAVGVWFVKRTLDATLQAVKDTSEATAAMIRQNEIAEAAQRAWITLRIEPRKVRKLGQGKLALFVDFTATNVGQTAALNFELNVAVFYKGQVERHDDLLEKIRRKLDGWRHEYNRPTLATLLPKDTEAELFEAEQDSESLNWWSGAGWPIRVTQPIFLFAALYRTAHNPDILHVSWRTWYLGERNGNGLFRPLLLEMSGDSEPPNLCAMPMHTTLMHEEYPANDGTRHQKGC